MKKSYIVFIFFMLLYNITKAQSFFMFSYSAPPAALDSIRVNLDTTITQSGWVNLTGDPSKAVKTATGGNSNNITVSTVSTSNWCTFGTQCAAPTNGSGATYLSYAPNVKSEFWFTSNTCTYNVAKPNFQINGLLTGHHYNVVFFPGAYTFSTSPNNNGMTDYRAYDGTNTYGPVSADGHNFTGSTGVTLSNVMPDGSGGLKLYMSIGTSGGLTADLTDCAGFIIYQID